MSMTIPSRPAPAPPGSRAQNAAAGANASLEQLRLQLQQQHIQQQQQGNGMQKISIKLPPPPKGVTQQQNGYPRNHHHHNANNNNHFDFNGTTTTQSSITRKFPQARYTPATDWDDSPFDGTTTTANGNFKKMPPPRPPPPKVQVNGRKATTAPAPPPPAQQTSSANGGGLLTNIFHRNKKTTTMSFSNTAANKAATQNRIYGLSSGAATTSTTSSTHLNGHSNGTTATSANVLWNSAWGSNSNSGSVYGTTGTISATSNGTVQEAQLISFDSPPSSPTFTQKSNSDCVSVDSFSSDSNFSSPNNGSVSQPESGFEDDFQHGIRSRPATTSPLDPWETIDAFGPTPAVESIYGNTNIGTAPVRNITSTKVPSNQLDNPLCNGKSLLPPAQSLTMPTIIKPKLAQKPKAPKPPMFGQPNYMLHMNGSIDAAQHNISPPMPKGVPPPPPPTASTANGASKNGVSLLDVISGKVDAMALSAGASGYVEEIQTPYAVALYDFDGVEEGDLSFRENEKIYLLEQVTETWYRGRTRTGCEGIFPENYVDIKVPLGATSGYSQPQPQAVAPAAKATTPLTARCLYNFPGEVEGDLALKEDDIVTILYRVNEDWIYGDLNGKQGQFPANFLEYVPENIPMP